jgi:hypothetical protein
MHLKQEHADELEQLNILRHNYETKYMPLIILDNQHS